MAFGGLLMILFWGGLIVLAVLLVRWLAKGGTSRNATYESSALEILKERYARGEIDKQEFEERKRDLDDS